MTLTASELTAAIEEAFRQEEPQVSDLTVEDMRPIFASVARGLLRYLERKEDEVFNTITIREGSQTARTYTVTQANLNINIDA